jgi:DNA polymerase alpha subunit A
LFKIRKYKHKRPKIGQGDVRRDWCKLSKVVGLEILNKILLNENKEETVIWIFDYLKEVANKMEHNGYDLSYFEIYKQLTKNIEEYGDLKALPHVKVAKRLRDNGNNKITVHSYIPYVICIDTTPKIEETTKSVSKGLADRAYHPSEIQANSYLVLDIEWYKENQNWWKPIVK